MKNANTVSSYICQSPDINNGINNGIKYHTSLISNVQILPLLLLYPKYQTPNVLVNTISVLYKKILYQTNIQHEAFLFLFPLISIFNPPFGIHTSIFSRLKWKIWLVMIMSKAHYQCGHYWYHSSYIYLLMVWKSIRHMLIISLCWYPLHIFQSYTPYHNDLRVEAQCTKIVWNCSPPNSYLTFLSK